MAKKKQTKAGFLREWCLPEGFKWHHLRYKNPPEKGVYWYYFSLFIRERDVRDWGTCISCGKPITVETSQAGHFCPASNCGRDLLFHPYNVNAECARCNAFDEGHLFGYEQNLKDRYGYPTLADLKERYLAYKNGPPLKDFPRQIYIERIKTLSSYTQRCSVDK